MCLSPHLAHLFIAVLSLKFTRDLALSVTTVFNKYDGDHALSTVFALSVPSGFFVGLLRVKLELGR